MKTKLLSMRMKLRTKHSHVGKPKYTLHVYAKKDRVLHWDLSDQNVDTKEIERVAVDAATQMSVSDVTTHTTPVVVYDRVAVEVAAVRSGAWFHSSILGYLQVGLKKDKSVFVSKRKQSKQAIKNRLYGQTAQMVVDIIIIKTPGCSTVLP